MGTPNCTPLEKILELPIHAFKLEFLYNILMNSASFQSLPVSQVGAKRLEQRKEK